MRPALSLPLALLAACASDPASPDPLQPRPVRDLATWSVRDAGAEVGRLVLQQIDDPAEPVRYYRVENTAGQWLGFIGTEGAVYQRVPFSMAEVFRGVHTMQSGLAMLFDRDGPLVLEAVSAAPGVDATEAVLPPPGAAAGGGDGGDRGDRR